MRPNIERPEVGWQGSMKKGGEDYRFKSVSGRRPNNAAAPAFDERYCSEEPTLPYSVQTGLIIVRIRKAKPSCSRSKS